MAIHRAGAGRYAAAHPDATLAVRLGQAELDGTMMDWAAALDFEQAARNVRGDTYGDWYRDPWGWPENEWAAKDGRHVVVARLNDHGAKRALPIEVPKENFVLRPAMLLDPIDRLAYQALVDSLSVSLIADMRDFAFGWRMPASSPSKGIYAKNGKQWEAFRDRLQELGDDHQYGLATDIVSFFQSVSIARLEEDIRHRVKGNAVIDRVVDYLRSWDDVPLRGGLPQRCLASSVLAQFFLRPLDDLLALHVAGGARRRGSAPVAVCRWMDDIWIFSNHWSGLRAAQLDLQGCLWDLALNLNAGKTHLREGEDLRKVIKDYEHSAADFGLRQANQRPLEELVERILDDPENASRTTIRFVTSRLRRHTLRLGLDGFVEKAQRLTHGADHLARLFRDLETWRDLEAWYVDYYRSSHRTLEWAEYQLGTMFPSSSSAPPAVIDLFAETLADGDLPILMVPLASQRLAAWKPDEARGLIESIARAGTYAHPFALRALAFAGLQVGVSKATTKSLLQQFAETEPQLAFLEDRGFKPLPVVADFSGNDA